MTFGQIFNDLLTQAQRMPNMEAIYFVSDDSVQEGCYSPAATGGVIVINRIDKETPNKSYLFDTVILLHECGHHHNIIEFKEYPIRSKSGYTYDPENYKISFLILKEECIAWLNAFKILHHTELSSLTFLHKTIIYCAMLYYAFTRLFVYLNYCLFNK